jgi:hypothetical protein
MSADQRVSRMCCLLARLSARVAAVKSQDPESGALSLEWVAIAIVLVSAALALATFLSGKLGALESLIGS